MFYIFRNIGTNHDQPTTKNELGGAVNEATCCHTARVSECSPQNRLGKPAAAP